MAAKHETKISAGKQIFCMAFCIFAAVGACFRPQLCYTLIYILSMSILKIADKKNIKNTTNTACRLRGTARTRRFERLRKQIQKAEGADKSLPPLCRPCFTADTAIPLKGPLAGLAACAAQPERGVSSDCANRFKKPRGQTKVCPLFAGRALRRILPYP